MTKWTWRIPTKNAAEVAEAIESSGEAAERTLSAEGWRQLVLIINPRILSVLQTHRPEFLAKLQAEDKVVVDPNASEEIRWRDRRLDS